MTSPSASDISLTTSTAATAQEPQGDFAIIARQAILDEQRDVYGYELFDRSTAHDAHTAASDAALLFNALSYAGAEALVGKKNVFINCTHESLAGGHLELIHPEKVVLEVPPLPDSATQEEIDQRVPVLQALRERGFRLALNQNALRKPYASWMPLASFIKLDLQTFKPELAGPLVKFASQYAKATLVAEKVETAEQFQMMSNLGVKLFQGFWFAKPSLVKATTIRPSQATIIQLINLVRKQADTSEIEDLLKKDPTLSFNLLRFINSSGFGLSCEVTSFRHAVMILGLKKLFRWAALLMTTSRDGAPPAVGQTAVVRGRHKASNVKLAMVVPGSGLVKAQAEAEGLDRIFRDAGFEWREPGCSMCLAMNADRLEPGERCASTSNRNFEGRQGPGGRTHLVSPVMAAAAAVAGHFVDVRKFLEGGK